MCLLFLPALVHAQVAGTVFKDFNANGTKDNSSSYNEVGMPSVRVIATKPNGSTLAVTYTGSGTATNGTGGYSVTGGTLGQIRLEFLMPDGFTFASKGAIGGTTILFPTAATQDLAVNAPEDYWDNASQPVPQLVIPCYTNGAITNPGNIANTGIVQFGNDQDGFSGITLDEVAKSSQVGTVWGEAYQRSADRFFFAAFLKRQAGLGPKGIGGVYIGEKNGSGVYNVTASFDLQSVVPSNSATPVDLGSITRVTSPTSADNYLAINAKNEPSRDLDAFAKVGTVSFGDIATDEANKQLVLTNLNQNSLMVLDISGGTASLNNATAATLGALLKTYSIATLPGVPNCTGGSLRIWGLKIYKGRGYLGAVCDASSSQNASNLKGYVLSFDPTNIAAGLTTELTLTLNYRDPTGFLGWHAWTTTWAQSTSTVPGFDYYVYCQPIISDIDFNENGDMTIAFMDRLGNQLGVNNYRPVAGNTNLTSGVAFGDILQARKNAAGVWVMEGTSGTIAPHFTTSDDQDTGYGNVTGTKGEYYNDRSGDGTSEGTMGSLAKIMGTSHIVSPVVDPYPANGSPGSNSAYLYTGGIDWFNSTSGVWDQTIRLYGPNYGVDFGKAVGLGDLEAALNPAPIEIGNRVWNDTDNDGIQDAGETGIAGVSVSLVTGAGALIATATTDANGNYYFSSGSGTSTSSALYSLTALTANSNYQLKFPTTTGGKSLVTANAGADNIDSDAPASGVVSFSTASFGANDHTFDVGYTTAPCALTLTATPGTCQSATNQYTVTGTVSFTNVPAGILTLTDDGANTNPGSITIAVPASTTSLVYSLSGIISGGRIHTITAAFSSTDCAPHSLTYLSPTSCTATPCIGTNLLQNPSFEQGFPVPPNGQATQVPPPGWIGGTADNNPNAFAAPDGYAYAFSGDNGGTLCQSVPATVGTTYNLKFYGGVHEVHNQTVTLSFLNSSSAVVGSPAVFNQVHILESDEAFGGPYSLSGVAPAGTTQVRVCAVSGNGAGYIYWSKIDNLCLTGAQPPCAIKVTATPGTCQTATNAYTVTGTISLTNATAGTILITNGTQSTTVAVTASTTSVAYSLTGSISDGVSHTVTASLPGCSTTTTTYTAPASCTVAPPCSISVVVTVGTCQTATNTYALTGTVSVTNSVAGIITITDGGQSTTVASTGNSSVAFSLTGLTSGTGSHTLTVTSSTSSCTPVSQTYTAPISCSIAPTAGLGDFVWFDTDKDGIQDAGEPGIQGVTVILYTNGVASATTVTSASGFYSFTGLTPGTSNSYVVGFTPPAGYTTTSPLSGTNKAKDSDADLITGKTASVTLAPGEFNPTLDAGYYIPSAGLGDFVWLDIDKDGIQGAGEPGIQGVTVILYTNGVASATTVTNASGFYSFTGLTPGTSNSYVVGFTAPAGYTTTSPLSGTDKAKDSDADLITGKTQSVTLAPGEFNPTLDAGYYIPSAGLGDFVWFDTDKDGIQDAGEPPIQGVTVILYTNGVASATTVTSASGFYSFTGLTPGSSNSYVVGFTAPSGYTTTIPLSGTDKAKDSDADLVTGKTQSVTLAPGEFNPTLDAGYYIPSAGLGDFVWFDTNKDGIQDAGEPGIQGVTVILYTNGVASATTVTSASGFYSFTGLTPGTSNSYVVGFTAPASYTTTTPLSGTDKAKDSDADLITGKTQSVTLAPSEFNPTIDAGYYIPSAGLGDFVWLDIDKDGIQDAGEPGIQGVTVILYTNGVASATTVTSASGFYSFIGLTPGSSNSYVVGFTAPAGYTTTSPLSGTDKAKDSDADLITGKTQSVTLAPGEFNPTLDAGYYPPVQPIVIAGLGDFVWFDTDKDGIQDAGEPGIQGVTVILYTNGVASATTVTNASGLYSFTGLTPGTSNSYVVGFTAPAGYTTTSPLSGTDKALDSDADLITGKTASVTLAPGEFNPTLDAGYYIPTPKLTIDKLVSKSKAKIGDIISYTIVLTNVGPISATNVTVRDSTTAGLTYVGNSASAPTGTTFTQGNPISLWNVATIAPGQSLSLTFQATADTEGILYNTATIPGDTARVCTSVPFRVCAGTDYLFRLTGAPSRSSYQWFKDNVAIQGATTNTLEVTAPGTYSLAVDNVTGKCTDFSCCPFIVEEDTLPSFQATAVPVTCVGNTAQANGKIILSNFTTGYTYQYSAGATFNAGALLSGAKQAIPANGVIASNLVNPVVTTSYTIRVYNGSGCYTDTTVLLLPTVCDCPPAICVPLVIKQTKGARRNGL